MVSRAVSHREMRDPDTEHLLRRLERMYEMAVWSAGGTMYMPLFGYNGEIVAYGYASDSIEQWHEDLDAVRRRRIP